VGGVAGPVLFTAAWVVSSLRQAGVPAAGVQLSGLAADDARDPQIMMAGFVVLGACSAGFGAALGRVSGGRWSAGPWLVVVAGPRQRHLPAVAARIALPRPGFRSPVSISQSARSGRCGSQPLASAGAPWCAATFCCIMGWVWAVNGGQAM
jgi:hypothetical protein